jgi:hypothetical protein
MDNFWAKYLGVEEEAEAENPDTPVDRLRTLATHGNNDVRRGVAINPSTPVDVLRAFVDKNDERVLDRVAMNTSAPPDLLEQIYNRYVLDAYANPWHESKAHSLKCDLAQNPQTPVHIMMALANDVLKDGGHSVVPWYLVQNPGVPRDLLAVLAEDLNPNVAGIALRRLGDDE